MNETETRDTRTKSDRDKAQIEPSPKDPDLFNWLESLFYQEPETGHYPEKISIVIVSGKYMERTGPTVFEYSFAPQKASTEAIKRGAGAGKPNREALVAMSNNILYRVQRDCDISQRAQIYQVQAWHLQKSDSPYERWPIRCTPSGRYTKMSDQRGGAAILGGDGEDDDTPFERIMKQQNEHHREMFDLTMKTFGGLLDRFDALFQRQETRIEKQDDRINGLNDQLERARSLEAEREERRAWNRMKIEGAEKLIGMGMSVAPVLVNRLVAKPGDDQSKAPSGELIALQNFFRLERDGGRMTHDMIDKAFGVFEGDDANRKMVKPGILSPAQAGLLWAVAAGEAPIDEIDRLVDPKSPLQVSFEQLQQLEQVFSVEHLLPIRLVFEGRVQKFIAPAAK